MKYYLGPSGDSDLLNVIDPDFVYGYGRYLYGGDYARAKFTDNLPGRKECFSQKTLDGHMVRLRSLTRSAIRKGLVPCIDVFPSVSDVLSGEYGLDNTPYGIGAGRKSAPLRPERHGFQQEVDKLYNTVFADLDSRPKVKRALPMLMYVLGLYAYGMEISDLLEIRHEQSARSLVDEGLTLYHPRLGVDVRLPERALRIIELINKGVEGDGYLIARPKAWLGLDTASIAQQVAAKADAFFRANGISLFHNRSVFADWLCMLKENELPDGLVVALYRNRKEQIAEHIQTIVTTGNAIANDRGRFLKRWYILCSYSLGVDSSDLKERVASNLDNVKDFNRNRDTYDPRCIEKRQVRGRMVKRNSPAISRYLFVFCTLDVARRLDAADNDASMLRVVGDKTAFATVKHSEVVDLVNFLRDFREDIEILDIEIPQGYREFAEGVRVKILSGPFKGYEGTIAQILKNSRNSDPEGGNTLTAKQESYSNTEDDTVYRVEIDGFAMSSAASAKLKGIEIQSIDIEKD